MVAATTLIDSAQEAFERLFDSEYRRVASVAFRITRDADDAEDVAQEVFAQLARSRDAYSAKARAWLYQAAVHTALNTVRGRRRRAEREAREFRLRGPIDSGCGSADDPESLAIRRAETAMLRSALLRIAPKDAEILALRYGGLSYREIGDVIGVDATHIGTRLARAERALKREIERETSR